MHGNTTVKSFTSFQVNESLLLRVCEAIRKGEADARRYSQVRSFEIYYEGFRQRMVFGRIMIIPAKIADSLEDFPSALLYGAMIKEIHPEQQADLYTYRLGESEFDEYNKRDLQLIKEKLFKDTEGKFRSIVLFLPTWGNPRDYVVLKFTRDPELLMGMVRHQIYGAYYNPAFSSAFNYLSSDTDNLHVSDITPKLNYPGLSEGLIQSFPNLEAGDGGSKTAAAKKPIMLLAKDTVNEINEEFLEPGELAVIDNLAEELKAKVDGNIEKPDEVAKSAASAPPVNDETSRVLEGEKSVGDDREHEEDNTGLTIPVGETPIEVIASAPLDVNHPSIVIQNAFKLVQQFQAEGQKDPQMITRAIALLDAIDPMQYTPGQEKGVNSAIKHLDEFMTYEGGADENLARAYTDLEDLCVDMGVKIAGYKPVQRLNPRGDYGTYYPCDHCEALFNTPQALLSHRDECPALQQKQEQQQKHTPEPVMAASQKTAATLEWGSFKDIDGYHWSVFERGLGRTKTIATGVAETQGEADQAIRDVVQAPEKVFNNRLVAKVVVACEGSKLTQEGTKLIATAKSGHAETLRINANRVKWVRPGQYTLAFRAAVETFVKSPRRNKTADVPLTFDEIWNDIAEDMGPAPMAEVEEAPAKGTSSTPSESSERSKERKSAPESDSSKDENPFPQKKEENAPEAKEAAFDMFIPGQVLKEFEPDLLRETVEYPTETFGDYDPAIGLPGDSPSGVQQSADGLPADGDPYVSTNPSAAMGLGRDGKPQILEGAPLRTEMDIRGYGFDQEFYAQNVGINPKSFNASYALSHISKKASNAELKAQFADFLKKAMGEIATTFIVAFKVTSRPMMNEVPGTGEINLSDVESTATFADGRALNVSSRVAYLMGKLTDSEIKEAINNAWAQAAVWNEDANGGYTYEVFVRPESIDKQTLILKYNFVVGTKGL
jgi:hypothetical protein